MNEAISTFVPGSGGPGDEPGDERRGTPSDEITPFFPDWVVSLQPLGAGRPVFDFPAADNEPMAIELDTRIANHVGQDHPFWAFARDESAAARVREHGVAALARSYVAHMRMIQRNGPYLLYGHCVGGYLAWETARQLLELGEKIAGICFYEVPLRADFTRVLPGHPPMDSANLWRLSHYYRVDPLPIDLTYVMTESWHERKWWAPWQDVALGSFETAVIPNLAMDAQDFVAQRETLIARQVRRWIDTAESRAHHA